MLAEDLHVDFDTEQSAPAPGVATGADEIDDAFGLLVDVLRTLPADDRATRAGRYQNRLAGVEAEALAARKSAGASDRDNETAAGRNRTTTTAEAKKKAKRAATVEKNPDLADDIANEELSPAQLDAIAEASEKTDGDAATDDEFIDKVKNASPDRAKELAREYVDNHDPGPDGAADTRHRSQRRRRRVSRFTSTKDDLDAILIKGDRAAIDEMWKGLNSLSKSIYRSDGGRDVPSHKHPRTRDQRLFDAAHQLLTASGGGGRASTGTSPNATVFVWAKLDDVLAGDAVARYADNSLVPQVVLSRYLCSGSIAGVVFDAKGGVLWHGREKRYATPAQVRALIARDRGCVLCRADASRCEAHHVLPFGSPAAGETDIEELALVCTDCHHWLHDTHHTLDRGVDGAWKARPATPDEIAPNGHHHRSHERHHRKRE